MNTIWFPDLSDGSGPKYLRLVAAIQQAIEDGQIAGGERLPPVRDLAWKLKVTPGTVARAYSRLTDAGLLQAAVGRGTFVAEPATARQYTPGAMSQIAPATPSQSETVDLRSSLLPDMGQEALIRRCYADMAQQPDPALLHYPGAATGQGVRVAAARWLQGSQAGRFEAEDVVLAHGGQHAIMLVLQCILQEPNPTVFTEDLTYAGFRHAARLLRARVVGLQCDSAGVRPDALAAACREHGPQVFCTSPEVHNPTAGHTGLARRKELADVARHFGCPVLEDSCYRNPDSGLPGYRTLLPDLGWYVTSLSKIISPALRVGFVLAPSGKIRALRSAAQFNSFGLSVPVCSLTERLLASPDFDRLCGAIRDRVKIYVQTAVNILGLFELNWQDGVPFLWLKLPRGWRASAFCRAAEALGIRLRSADDFSLIDGRAPHAIRIAVNGMVELERFEWAMRQLEHLLSHPPEQIEV